MEKQLKGLKQKKAEQDSLALDTVILLFDAAIEEVTKHIRQNLLSELPTNLKEQLQLENSSPKQQSEESSGEHYSIQSPIQSSHKNHNTSSRNRMKKEKDGDMENKMEVEKVELEEVEIYD
eukprot:Pgem_evm1s8199